MLLRLEIPKSILLFINPFELNFPLTHFFSFFWNEILSTLHCEHNMDINLRIGICHVSPQCDKLHVTPPCGVFVILIGAGL